MNYQEALAYIYGFTDYERSGKYTRDRNENLTRTARLLELLGDPHHAYSNTLIAGTKGKGSTAAMVESVLREAGVKTGLYTQPDLHTFRERIRVNGALIPEVEVGNLIPEIKREVERVQADHEYGPFITYEIGTALAFLYFAHSHVQHAVVEVGLGGRLDATNLTHPLVSVITSISYDHMSVLGNTLKQIATEKAGIIKENGLVVTSASAPEALLAIAAKASERQARMVRVGSAAGDTAQTEVEAGSLPSLSYRYQLNERIGSRQCFTVWTPEREYANLELALAGEHQLENATVAVATLEMLREKGIDWDEAALRKGLASVHWPARIEVVGRQPTIVVDGAHNTDSIQKLVRALHVTFDPRRLIFVLSTSKDKDLVGIIKELAQADAVVLTSMNNPRVTPLEDLRALFAEHAPRVELLSAPTSEAALDMAVGLAAPEDLVCATGSIYLAGEALRWAAARGDQLAASEIEGVDH
ncbi:bifunctional folylpolyglutamate synthase/dihydrofolate synthase [Ktedonospora formicarum]|uniref:bifunctional folylpolyglutamate synthase/dihydrofolate synthase n=1 Tax=Ktedonospora formicarum TaxID=2778364 RepID=UPI001C68BD50|nr:folylpolyglutamate synthase/dihydrofolate synthase family protein [Ktedonospora formicarum]